MSWANRVERRAFGVSIGLKRVEARYQFPGGGLPMFPLEQRQSKAGALFCQGDFFQLFLGGRISRLWTTTTGQKPMARDPFQRALPSFRYTELKDPLRRIRS